MSDRLLIVGGTGFIGNNLLPFAINLGYKVTILSIHRIKNEDKVFSVEYLNADICNFHELQNILSKNLFTYVINLSGYIDHSGFFDNGDKVIEAHFNGVKNIVKCVKHKGLKRFIQIGSSDEYGDNLAPQDESQRERPISPYSFAKVAASQFLQMLHKSDNFPVVILRLFLVYGPGQDINRFLPQVIQGCLMNKHIPLSHGRQLRDFCFVDDISIGILDALKRHKVKGELINLASGDPISIHKVVEEVREEIGMGIPEFGKIPFRSGENMQLYADISKAKRLLDWEPKTSFKEGLKKTVHSYIQRIN